MTADEAAEPRPLPARAPRPLWLHWIVASVVVFLAIAVATSFFGVRLDVIAIVAAVIGIAIAPFSRRAERRALAARDRPSP